MQAKKYFGQDKMDCVTLQKSMHLWIIKGTHYVLVMLYQRHLWNDADYHRQ